MANYIKSLFDEVGIESELVEYQAGRSQLVATLTGSLEGTGKTIVFSGHMDVVAANEQEWTYPPFDATEVDGKIYSRGTSDMKGGLMAAVVAMINLKENGAPFVGTVKLLATTAEETGAQGAAQLKELGYVEGVDGVIIAEPTSNTLTIAEKGGFWLRFTTKGKEAHGSMPDEGVNAIDHMLIFLQRMKETIDFSVYENEILGKSTGSLDIISGGHTINIVPGECSAEIDIRTVPGQKHEDILAQLETIRQEITAEVENFDLTIEVLIDLPPTSTSFDNEFVQTISDVVYEVTGIEQAPKGITEFSDLSQFLGDTNDFPGVILGCGDTYQPHQVDEYIEISYYLQGITIFEEVIKRFLQATE
ncbi:MAG: ArgE/DapE family deacylase [Bacteroides sp.]|nr:ArgE/DapE family deacylase [Bacteroides sp.]